MYVNSLRPFLPLSYFARITQRTPIYWDVPWQKWMYQYSYTPWCIKVFLKYPPKVLYLANIQFNPRYYFDATFSLSRQLPPVI